MDQERVVGRIKSPFTITGKSFLKLIYLIGKRVHERRVWNREHPELNKKFIGEQQWFDLANSSAKKNGESFMNSEINFDKVNEQFKDIGITFSTRENKDGSIDVAWFSRDDALAKMAIQKAMKKIVSDSDKFMDSVKKDVKSIQPREQIKHFKKMNKSELRNLKETIGKSKPLGRSK